MRRGMLVIFFLLLGGSLSWGQSGGSPRGNADAGVRRSWPQAVQALADALAEPADAEALSRALPPSSAIRRFDRSEPQDRLALRHATAGAVVVMAHGYPSTPRTVATDLAEALREAALLPDAVRDEFAVDAPAAALKRANETAAQWVMSTLQPGVEQPVGVIALWREQPPQAPSQQPAGTMIFILVKGQEMAPAEYRVSYVIYGDTTQIIR